MRSLTHLYSVSFLHRSIYEECVFCTNLRPRFALIKCTNGILGHPFRFRHNRLGPRTPSFTCFSLVLEALYDCIVWVRWLQGPLRLAPHTWLAMYLSSKVRLRALEGCRVSSKCHLKVQRPKSGEVLERTKKNNILPDGVGVIKATKIHICHNNILFSRADHETRVTMEKTGRLKQVDNRIITLKRETNKLKDILAESGTYQVCLMN